MFSDDEIHEEYQALTAEVVDPADIREENGFGREDVGGEDAALVRLIWAASRLAESGDLIDPDVFALKMALEEFLSESDLTIDEVCGIMEDDDEQ